MSFDAANQLTQLVDPYWRAEIEETDKINAPFIDWLQKKPAEDANILGQKVKVRTSYNESESGAAFDGSAFATGGNSGFTTFFVPYRTISGQGLLTKEAIDNDDGKSQYHPVVEEFRILVRREMQNLNRAALLDDGTGRRAVVTTNYAGGGTAGTIVAAPGTGFGNKGSQFLNIGKMVSVYNAAATTQRTGTFTKDTIATNVLSTGTVTLTGGQAPTDMVATDIVVPEGMGGRGINGVEYWSKISGSIGTVALSSTPGLKAQHIDGSSGAIMLLVESMFSQLAHKIDESVALGQDGQEKHEGFWSPTQRERYRKEAIGLGIAMLGAGKIDTGYAHTEEINNYTMHCIGDHSNTRINFLRPSDWYRIQRGSAEKPFERYAFNGQTVFNKYNSTGGETSGMGFLITAYFNLACKNTRNQAAIYSLPTTGLQGGNA
jgi:hypothetical protein